MIPAIVTLFAGQVRVMPGDSRTTGIFKTPVAGRVAIGCDGLAGDEQADRRVHGGPDKALHFYPADHYRRLAARFPALAAALVPGSIGENISAAGIDETAVCIGDVFALGSARLQVCQPRQPCWKIDARYGVEGMTAFIAEAGLTGGYLRVLEPGEAASGMALALLERQPLAPTLAELWQVWRAQRPAIDRLQSLAAAPGLSANWQRKLAERCEWLRRNRADL